MKAILKFFPFVAAITLAVACGDDDDNPPPKEAQCKSPYTDLTESKLDAKIASSGKCADDAAGVCGNDLVTATAACAKSCITMSMDPGSVQACTLKCLKDTTTPTPSDDCLGCYIASATCAIEHCLSDCLESSTSAACIECRNDNGCASGFYTCSGLPLPSNEGGGEGGMSNSGGSSGAPAKGGAGGNGGEPETGGTGGVAGSGGAAGGSDAGAGGSAGSGEAGGGASGAAAGAGGAAAGAGGAAAAGAGGEGATTVGGEAGAGAAGGNQ